MGGKTVFVIGAGASEEINLPTGEVLKKQIAHLLDFRLDIMGRLDHGDIMIFEALKLYARDNQDQGNINSYLEAARQIKEALPLAISIDNLIEQHRDNQQIAVCAKLAIVRSILKAEQDSLLYFDKTKLYSGINLDTLVKTWYVPFFKLIAEGCSKDDLEERFESIALIIFNYDRCIEFFIYHGLKIFYKLDDNEASNLVKKINFFHPYGEVGVLPGHNPNGAIGFGGNPNPEALIKLIQTIKTFTEGADPKSSEILKIRENIGFACKLVFLGFAFHKLNMKLITPDPSKKYTDQEVLCYASTLGFSDSDKGVIKRNIKELYRNEFPVNMANLKCYNFFSEFWKGLAF